MKSDYIYRITIDDGSCKYEYDIQSSTGDKSIYDIAKVVHEYIESDKPLEGKHVGDSDIPNNFFKN